MNVEEVDSGYSQLQLDWLHEYGLVAVADFLDLTALEWLLLLHCASKSVTRITLP